MSSRELNNLVRIELLKVEAADQKEIDGLLASGRARLTDAKKTGLSTESRFDLAYSAAHAFSLSAMRWHGYRPNNKRFVVFSALPHTLGLDAGVWRVLEKCHTSRNSVEYEGYFDVEDQLLADLLKATEIVLQEVEKLGPVRK